MDKTQHEKLIELLDMWGLDRQTSHAKNALCSLMVGAICAALKMGVIDSGQMKELNEKYKIGEFDEEMIALKEKHQ